MPSSEPVFNRNLRLWDIGSQDSLDKELDRLSASYPHRDSNSELKDSCWTLLYHGAHLAFPRRLHKIFQDGMWCRKNQRQKYSEGWFFFFFNEKSARLVSGGLGRRLEIYLKLSEHSAMKWTCERSFRVNRLIATVGGRLVGDSDMRSVIRNCPPPARQSWEHKYVYIQLRWPEVLFFAVATIGILTSPRRGMD